LEAKLTNKKTAHKEELVRLKRIENQIRGVQKMIDNKKYCINILKQLTSIVVAIKSVDENIQEKHLKDCLPSIFATANNEDKAENNGEIVEVLKKIRRYRR
jgi:DNA-binding FrmR family transcriptional regulator